MDRIDYFYFVIDVSRSMCGRKIGAVNDEVNNIVHRLKRFVGSRTVTAKMVVMTYANIPQWSNFVPVDVSSFCFSDIQIEGEESNLGKALLELNEKMLRQGDTDPEKGASTTIVIFSDGLSTDELQDSIRELHENLVFNNSTRIGVTFEDELSKDIAIDCLKLLVNKTDNIIVEDFILLNKILFEKYT